VGRGRGTVGSARPRAPSYQRRPPANALRGFVARVATRHWITERRIAGVASLAGTIAAVLLVRYGMIAVAPACLVTGSPTVATDYVPSSVNIAGPEPSLAYADIEAAARRYTALYRDKHAADARDISEQCHSKVAAAPSWGAADRCIAFDYIATTFSDAAAHSKSSQPDLYFQFTQLDPEGLYSQLTQESMALSLRLVHIRPTAIPVAMNIVWPNGEPGIEHMRSTDHDAGADTHRSDADVRAALGYGHHGSNRADDNLRPGA
jgi:hypothetical protein